MMVHGIDLGSRQVKLISRCAETGSIQRRLKFHTLEFYRQYSRHQGNQLEIDLNALGIENGPIVSTGYGRFHIQVAHAENIPELQAHVYGAIEQSGFKDFLLVDLGGQDSKIIQVENRAMVDFAMNDKCAASTGRFLENMAQALQLSLEELSECYENPCVISSTCAVFSETESLSLLFNGTPIREIAAGINLALFKRLMPMIGRFKFPYLLLSGGAAQSKALHYFFQQKYPVPVELLPDPIFNGAIGCCAYYNRS